eukprot:2484238-Alexandrium_andersonii.AAC.1
MAPGLIDRPPLPQARWMPCYQMTCACARWTGPTQGPGRLLPRSRKHSSASLAAAAAQARL